jgi:hypothetical protein
MLCRHLNPLTASGQVRPARKLEHTMMQRGHRSLRNKAAGHLEPGETIDATARGYLVRASLGLSAMGQRPKTFHFVLTNRRLLILEADPFLALPTKKLVGQLSRQGLYSFNPRSGMQLTYELGRDGASIGQNLTFPGTDKKDGRALGDAIGWANT